jgi:hypothetical protein
MSFVSPTPVNPGDAILASLYNQDVVANTDALYQTVRRIAHGERTSTYSVSSTSLASAADVFSSDLTITADGTTKYLFEFYCQRVETGSANQFVFVNLVDGSGTGIGSLGAVLSTAGTMYSTMFARTFYAPPAGSQSFNVRAVISGGANGTLYGGTGGTGVTSVFPMYLSIYGPALT